jgi:class 3 adenylate cyclase
MTANDSAEPLGATSGTADERRSYVRIDLETRVVKTDEATRMAWFEVRPNPRRYRKFVQDGKTYFEDKYLADIFSEEMLLESVPKLEGMPISHLPRHIDNSVAYSGKRRGAIEAELTTGEHVLPEEALKAQEPLRTAPEVRNMTFLSIDICGSTALGAKDRDAYDKCFDIFFREMATVAAQFSGEILKSTGDGLIVYVDAEAINTQCDAAVDMGLTFLRVQKEAVNPALQEAGLPTLQIRVGAEHGQARVKTLSAPAIGWSTPDISADALNRAKKVEGTCEPNSFRIGEALYRRIDVQWLERASLTKSDISAEIGLADYKIYEVI